ncbi:MAG: hypothetical protein WCP29_14850 [Acidobacteriota bacterium]
MTRGARNLAVKLLLAFAALALAPLTIHAGPPVKALPHVLGTRHIVLEQLEAVLALDPGLEIIGQGSWLRSPSAVPKKGGPISRAYSDPLLGGTSDHDLRLVMKGGDEAAMASKWRNVQTLLRDRIRNLFPAGADPKRLQDILMSFDFTAEEASKIASRGATNIADAVLKSVNLYSPPQLVRFVVDEKTAASTFKQLRAVPNLFGRELEGVWGEGSAAATQLFESGGHLFYADAKGELKLAFVDLVHLTEGYGRYSLGGAANMSVQWAEKAAEAIRTGDMSLVEKYLSRLRGTLTLAVNKGNLPPDAMRTTFGRLDQFITRAKAGELAVLEGGLDLRTFLQTARKQSSVLGEFARNSGSMDRELLLAILEPQPVGRLAKVGQWFQEVWPSAESLAVFERALQAAFVVLSTWQVSGTWGEKGMEDALRQAGVEGSLLASLPTGAVMALANAMLDNAKEFGYNTAVRSQEWRDFLAGISSVKGYEGQTGLELSIGKLALQSVSPAEIKRAVELQAYNISQLKETSGADSDATAAAREAIRTRLVTNMTPIVLAEWQRERKRLITIYLDLALQLDEKMNNLILAAGGIRPMVMLGKVQSTNADVHMTSSEDLKTIQALLDRMDAAITPLGGRRGIVPFSYRGSLVWEQDGKLREVSTTSNLNDLLAPQTMQFPGPGSYPMVARFKLEVSAPSLGGVGEAADVRAAQGLLARDYQRRMPFTVDVGTGWWTLTEVSDIRGIPCVGCERVVFSGSSCTFRYQAISQKPPNDYEIVTSWTELPRTMWPGVAYSMTVKVNWSPEGARPGGPPIVSVPPLDAPPALRDAPPSGGTAQWTLVAPSADSEFVSGRPPFTVFARVSCGQSDQRRYRYDWFVGTTSPPG